MRSETRTRRTLAVLLAALAVITTSCAEKQETPAKQETVTVNPAIIDISPNAPPGLELKKVEDYTFLQVIEGDMPSYGSRQDFVSADGKVQVDYSQYTSMTLKLVNWPADEFMLFVEGQVEITDEQGRGKTYGPGDMIMMPRGFSGTWRQLGPIRKISVTYDWRE